MFKRNYLYAAIVGLALTACGGKSFDVGLTGSNFKQNTVVQSVPIDILWVVDNSGSMETSQDYVAANVASFIDKFQQTNFDFQITVVTTEAYLAMPMFTGNSSWSRFKDRNAAEVSGVRVITPQTANIQNVFQINVRQGITGSADERGLQSMEQALVNVDNLNDNFPRVGAFLAVIFMTDEEDFSWNGTANIQFNGATPNTIDDPRLIPISYYVDFLDNLTESTPEKRNYMVNTIGIFDQPCLDDLSTSFTGRRFTERYGQLSDATDGVKASLCDDFSDILSGLTDSILQQTTKFYLDRAAVPDTIQVIVDGVTVPSSGYIYDPTDNSITFQSSYIPGQGANIQVLFQPAEL